MFKPMILVDNEPVKYFVGDGNIPKNFTRIEFDNDGQLIQLGLKLSPDDVFAALGGKWEIAISKDLRLPALVSLIKAAYLTFFELLRYRCALSNTGYFVGRQILGEFFLQNHDKPKSVVLENAYPFFQEFKHMARPIQSSSYDFKGTITDGLLYLCKEKSSPPWAFIVFIKTSQLLHAVMIPVLDQPDTVDRYFRFLQDDNEIIEVTACHIEQEQWKINKESIKLTWPKSGNLYA